MQQFYTADGVGVCFNGDLGRKSVHLKKEREEPHWLAEWGASFLHKKVKQVTCDESLETGFSDNMQCLDCKS